jgi:hypothetical protein
LDRNAVIELDRHQKLFVRNDSFIGTQANAGIADITAYAIMKIDPMLFTVSDLISNFPAGEIAPIILKIVVIDHDVPLFNKKTAFPLSGIRGYF